MKSFEFFICYVDFTCHTKALPPCHTEPLGEVSKTL